MKKHNITQYSIHHYPPLELLVSHFVYTGSDWDADMAAIAADPETQQWWKLTDSMQESFEPGATGSSQQVPWWTVSEDHEVRVSMLTLAIGAGRGFLVRGKEVNMLRRHVHA